MDLMAAYLNPAEQGSEVRTTLARLARAKASTDEPDRGVDPHVQRARRQLKDLPGI